MDAQNNDAVAPPDVAAAPPRPIDRALHLFADVRRGEGWIAILLTANVFLLLTAYYLLKVAREPLILVSGAETKSYAAAGQALVLIPVLKLYDALARRVGRMKLISTVSVFFCFNLLVFVLLSRLRVPLGVAFYLWVGVFSVMMVAQFWSFANDIYTPEQGKRLFAILGIGSSVGAVVGTRIAKGLFPPLGPYGLMLVAAGILLVCLALFWIVDGRMGSFCRGGIRLKPKAPFGKAGGFQLLFGERYLLLVGALAILRNWVNTVGEYVLDRILLRSAAEHTSSTVSLSEYVASFKADYFGWVNSVEVLVQLFLVSRIIKYVGITGALLVLPLISLTGNLGLSFFPILALSLTAKVSENSVDYSLQSTAGNSLFLIVTRDAKYKAKAVIDTFLVRVGDVLSAAGVWLGGVLGAQTAHFTALNVVLSLAWLGLVFILGQEYRRYLAYPGPVDRSIPGATAAA
ncbi:MAG TPA: Npt1/Npt2 family nucleotide transporter [Myxococcaceae bacterium]|nr:Npt1/Npt2 family nucleotide transporter [Myxococcaceae bacterium]